MTAADAYYVCHNLRDAERRQAEALEWLDGYDPELLAEHLLSRPEPAWAARHEGRPVVIGGFSYQRPGVIRTWMLGTDDWPRVVRSVTRHTRRVMRALLEHDVHRIETVCASAFTEAHRWYRLLGLEHEATMVGYGRDGSDFHLYRRLRSVLPRG